jgi:hypothetical protein
MSDSSNGDVSRKRSRLFSHPWISRAPRTPQRPAASVQRPPLGAPLRDTRAPSLDCFRTNQTISSLAAVARSWRVTATTYIAADTDRSVVSSLPSGHKVLAGRAGRRAAEPCEHRTTICAVRRPKRGSRNRGRRCCHADQSWRAPAGYDLHAAAEAVTLASRAIGTLRNAYAPTIRQPHRSHRRHRADWAAQRRDGREILLPRRDPQRLAAGAVAPRAHSIWGLPSV